MDPDDVVKQFVEGTVSPRQFEQEVYSNEALIRSLENFISLPSYASKYQNLYTYVVDKDFSLPGDVLNLQGVMALYLQSKHITFSKSRKPEEDFALIMKVQPAWLDLPQAFMQSLIEQAGSKSGTELEAWLKSEIKLRFVSLKKPPKWLQSPKWPIRHNEPAVFVGQLDATELHHDQTVAYVFFFKSDSRYVVVTQST